MSCIWENEDYRIRPLAFTFYSVQLKYTAYRKGDNTFATLVNILQKTDILLLLLYMNLYLGL